LFIRRVDCCPGHEENKARESLSIISQKIFRKLLNGVKLPKKREQGFASLPGTHRGRWQDCHRPDWFFRDYLASSTSTMNGRKYFVSSNDFIGLVPEAAQEGDMICVFMGGKTPFLVRPVGGNYQLLGACYVHRIMYGEAMEEFEKKGGKWRISSWSKLATAVVCKIRD
jgi:hypothetical protein